MVNMILASDKNGLIGDGDKLPWYIRSELDYFKRMTLGGVCVMGRKTFESLPKPLKDRTNLVLTRGSLKTEHLLYNSQGYDIQTTSILDLIQERYPSKTIWVIGGKSVYEQFLEKGVVEYIYHSVVDGEYSGNVYMKDFTKGYELVSTFRPSPQFINYKYKKV